MENKEFEAWSLSEQIQDRIVRASPYKSAVLSPTSSNHNKKPTASSQQPSQPQPQPLLSQPQQLLQEQPQPEPQPQVQVQQQHSPVSKLVQKPLSTPLVESISSKRQWQWQWRGQSSAKEIAGDKTPRKTAANTITSKMSIGGPGLGSPVVGTFGDSCTGQTLGNQGAVKSGNEDGSSHPTLRRTRSAPILASGQLSYADILKASIKASSDPNLSSSSSSSSGYVSLLSPESNASHLHLSGSSSPLVTTNTTSVSGTFSSFNNSPDSTSFRSRLIVPLTPTRTMKPLRRRSLSNIKSEMTASSAPLKPLTPLATPLKAVESPSPGASTSTMDVDETPLSKVGGIGTGSVHKEVVIMDHSAKDSEDVEMSAIEETVEERGMEDVTSDLIAASAEEKESLMVQEKAEAMTGLSFFAPPEELDAEESSPDAIHHAQSIVAGSMMEFEPTVDVVKETLPDSETTLGTGATSNLIRTVSAPAMVSPLSVSLATKVSLKGDGDLENDSYESITLESPDSANIGVTTSVQEEMKEEQGISVEHSSVVVMDEPETEHEAEPTESTASVAVAAVAAELECPFQKQLALQEQEETEIQQSKIAAEFKPRRKRNNSSGGKKLLLKKKTNLPNLRNSFQQQQQQQSQQQQQATSQSESDGSNLDSPISASGRVASIDYVIPPFYFPKGKPVAASKRRQRVHSAVTKAKEIFVVAENGVLSEAGFVAVTVHCCELPRYMNRALFRKIDASGSNEVRFQEFERVWESLVETCPDEISMIFSILKQPTANVLTPTDFEAVLQDLVLFHPGLEFLSGNAVFQERYLETVITRIFYEANRRYGTMKQSDLRRSNFDKTLRKLENSDLNQTEDCFSYKHFYVIYCKFWELDQDHDLILDEQDLAGYSGGAISTRIIRRVMQGYGNETGMFIVPDQGLVLQQQQQQLLLMQQQQLLQQQQQQLLLQQQQLLLRQQQQHQQQQHQQQEQLQAGNTDMDLDTAVLAHRPESADNSGDDEEVDEGMTEMTTPPGDGSPVPETKTLRRSKTMTLSGVNISSEFLTEGMMSPGEDAPTSSSPITATTTASPPAPVMISPTTPAATVTVQRTIPPGPGTQCRPYNYRMTYKGFIWFLLAETDKQTATSIEYWFRCMDLDGDGMLTVFELEQLFQEQAARMTILGMESFGFRDAICQMQDLVGPKETGLVRLSDLKQCGQAGPFIDLFCNVIRWRNFEAHQHQIRMRQQQIAMQRATEAAWEEVAVGEDLFDDEDEDEDEEGEGDDGEGCEDGDEDDEDEEEQDLEDEDEGEISDDYADGTERSTSPLSDAYSKPNAPNPTLFSPDIKMAEGRALSSSTSALLSSAAAESSCVGLGLAVEMDSHHDTNSKDLTKSPYQSLGRRGDRIKTVVPGEQNDELEDDDVVQDGSSSSGNAIIIGGSVELSPAATKALTRRNKEKRLKRRQSMARLALLEEQRKEKALLATIRESPWIVYVESEYEKLVTIERPQSRTGWEQEDEEEEEEEEEEEDDIDEGEDEVGEEEEVMDEEAHHQHHHQHQHQHHQHHHHLNIVEGGVDPIQLQLQRQRQQQQRQQNQRELQQQQQELHIQQQRLQLQQQHQQHHQQQFGQISIDP
ncbi:Serine/threonine-protein phosphatase 2A regulatory subunit B'' subunit alpha [Mortierella sp. NVP41]|nr:Serine/threonine-protein phosphatase 2A regulatory subunit B'' subunit alpha [Mortierella sp. NVP41]